LGVGDYRLEMWDTWGDGLDPNGHVFLEVDGVELLNLTGNVFGRYYLYNFSVNESSAPIPEPATMMLFGLGLLGLAGVSRKKN
jgi:hypothetical protein